MASLDPIPEDTRGSDACSTINQAHSPRSLCPAVATNNPLLIQNDLQPSTPGSPAVPESNLAVYEIDALPQNDNDVAKSNSETHEARKPSDVAIATDRDSSPVIEMTRTFRFLDLASEMRNRIYHFVLGPPQDPSICLTQVLDTRPPSAQSGSNDFNMSFRTKSVKINCKHKDPDWGVVHGVKPCALSILLVSKQIYVEAFHVFYTSNCFSFTDTALLYRFLKNIGYTRRQHLTMIYFLWRGPDAKEAFRLLKTCRRLRLLQFTVPCSQPPGYEALKEVRVETAKARALVHFAITQNPPLDIHDHNSCFGDYQCHCICRRPYEPASSMLELENAMMRPRREQDFPDPEEKFNLFKPKREHFKKSEEQDLLQEKAAFHGFIDRIEQQGKQLIYLGRRNKVEEAALSQTLRGSEVDDYFREFAEKLAKDKRLLKYQERWHAKRKREQETKERWEREKREADEEKERGIRMRREARELQWKIAREAREDAKKAAREERELKRRTAREAKEREKMMAREVRAQKKAAREATGRVNKGTSSVDGKKGPSKAMEL